MKKAKPVPTMVRAWGGSDFFEEFAHTIWSPMYVRRPDTSAVKPQDTIPLIVADARYYTVTRKPKPKGKGKGGQRG